MSKQTTAPSEPIRDARKLGTGKMLILGIQHMFAMFGATILVPIITGLSVQVTLICAGLGTLFFHLCTKFKVPAFLGSSFAFLGGFAAVKLLDTGVYANLTEAEKLPYACGGIVVAGLLYLIMAAVVKFVGIKRVMRFLPPVVTGPIIILIGLILAPSAVTNASENWWLAALSVVVIIVCNMWGKGMIKIIPILMGVLIPYIVALCCGMIDFSGVAQADIVGLPPFQMAKFDLSAILIMAPIAIASMMEHIGDISAISATCGENYIEDPGLHRSLIGDGLATSLAALFGGPGSCTFGGVGFGDCVKACDYDAIAVIDGLARVNPLLCAGCGKCAAVCPKGIIEVLPAERGAAVRCSNTDKGAAANKVCKVSCIGCHMCEKKCPADAIHVEDNLARVDLEKCTGCGTCASVCPRKCIEHTEFGPVVKTA